MAGIVKTNYRERDIAFESLQSIMVKLTQSWQHDSATGNIFSFSMEGYGRPAWVIVQPYEDHRGTFIHINVSVSTTGSMCVASVMGASLVQTGTQGMSFGSIAATITIRYKVIGLIASR